MKQRLYVVMAIVMVLAVGLSSALIGGCAAPPAEAPEAAPPGRCARIWCRLSG